MPLWVPDTTGRFVTRPKFTARELDDHCESEIAQIHLRRHGKRMQVVTEDDLSVLLETMGVDVRLFEDFGDFPEAQGWVQGSTEFGTEIIVRIAKGLLEDERNANRRRSTLAHETGHVLTLSPAYQKPENVISRETTWRYSGNRSSALRGSHHDWAEWQSDYCIGALLIPRTALTEEVGHVPRERQSVPSEAHILGQRLIDRVVELFEVSHDAACMRLYALGYLRRGQMAFGFRASKSDSGSADEKRVCPPRTGLGYERPIYSDSLALLSTDSSEQLSFPFDQMRNSR